MFNSIQINMESLGFVCQQMQRDRRIPKSNVHPKVVNRLAVGTALLRAAIESRRFSETIYDIEARVASKQAAIEREDRAKQFIANCKTASQKGMAAIRSGKNLPVARQRR